MNIDHTTISQYTLTVCENELHDIVGMMVAQWDRHYQTYETVLAEIGYPDHCDDMRPFNTLVGLYGRVKHLFPTEFSPTNYHFTKKATEMKYAVSQEH